MLKFLIKLAVAALIANATWRLASVYIQFYRFQDAVTEVAQFGREKTRRGSRAAHLRIWRPSTMSRWPRMD